MMLGILGGRIYDPRNSKDGEVGDIWVKDGRVVTPEDVDQKAAQTVDATGLVHAMLLRIQALLLPIKTLVLSGH